MQAPKTVGRYEVMHRIGYGGMGALYLGRDPNIDRLVAIKFLHTDLEHADARERFAREARAAGALSHPNIVTVFDYGEFEGSPFIVMEYIRGETLREVIKRRAPFPIGQKLIWLEQLCSGLAYAHEAGIVHRDIKPANLMIDPHGALKILDFGIARLAEPGLTVSGPMGTPGFMSPEQVRGDRVDGRSDLFAVGAVAYELLTYREAFGGDSQPSILNKVLHEDPPPLAQVAPEVGPDIAAVVARALQKRPADRFDSGVAMLGALQEARERLAGIRLTPSTPGGPPRRVTPVSGPNDPTAPHAHHVHPGIEDARRASADGNHTRALELLDGVLESDPDNAEAKRLRDSVIAKRHTVRMELAKIRDAERQAATAAKAKLACDRGWRYVADGAWDAARRAADEAIALDPKNEHTLRLVRAVEQGSSQPVITAHDVFRKAPAPAAVVPHPAAPPQATLERTAAGPRSRWRQALLILGVAAVMVAGVGFGVYSLLQQGPASSPPTQSPPASSPPVSSPPPSSPAAAAPGPAQPAPAAQSGRTPESGTGRAAGPQSPKIGASSPPAPGRRGEPGAVPAATVDIDGASAQLAIAKSQYTSGNLEAAHAAFRKANQLNPGDSVAQAGIQMIEKEWNILANGILDKAESDFLNDPSVKYDDILLRIDKVLGWLPRHERGLKLKQRVLVAKKAGGGGLP